MALQVLSLAGKGLSALGKRRAAKKARRQAQPQTGQQVAEKITGRKQESVDKRQNPPISFDSPVTMNVSESTGRSSRTATTVEGVALQIETKTIRLKDALRRSLILDKAHEKNKQIISKKAKRTKAEEDAEKGSPKGKRFSLPIPGAGKVKSFWERIKDFFITILWGWIAVRLVDKTELLGNLLPKIGAAVDWVIDAGIKFLDFAGTALMWGYAAYDWTRMQIGNVFGENALESFDGFMGHLNKVINGVVAIGIGFAAMALAWPKGPGGKGRGPKPKGPKGKPRSWQNRRWRFPWEKAPVTKGKGGGNWFTKLQQKWFKRNPKVTVGKGGAGKGLFGFLKNIKLPVPKWLTGWKGNALINSLLAYFEWKGRREEGQSRKKALAGTAASTAGGFAGFWAGAKLGAAAGASIGAFAGGVGAGPGALIGGIIGGITGSMGGSWLAGSASDAIVDQIEKPQDTGDRGTSSSSGEQGAHHEDISSKPSGAVIPSNGLIGDVTTTGRKLYLHWSAGSYTNTSLHKGQFGYHTYVTGDGKLVPNELNKPYGHSGSPPYHTYGRNKNAAAIGVAGMHGASRGGSYGNQPIKPMQYEMMAKEAARLAKTWGWGKSDINANKVITHWEADKRDFSAAEGGGVERWDLAALYEGDSDGSGPDKIRGMIKSQFHKGGEVPGTGERMAKLLGGEIVIDVDSAGPAKDMLLAINQASTYEGVVDAIRKFAPYETTVPETITVPNPQASLRTEMALADSKKKVDVLPIFLESHGDPYEILYKG